MYHRHKPLDHISQSTLISPANYHMLICHADTHLPDYMVPKPRWPRYEFSNHFTPHCTLNVSEQTVLYWKKIYIYIDVFIKQQTHPLVWEPQQAPVHWVVAASKHLQLAPVVEW
jgi:hypothetical protein